MFGKIIYISDNVAHIEIPEGTPIAENLMNMHVIFEDEKKKILGEIEDISEKIIKVGFLGEIVNGRFVGGVIRKPTLSARIRIITKEELALIIGEDTPGSMILGNSPLYDDCQIRVDINDLFSNHMAIFGNTGSGKSCGVARLLQNVFNNPNFLPYKSNFFIFDAYGEYHNAFKDINKINPNLHFKYYTTNKTEAGEQKLKIPLWLLNVDDLALLLGAENVSQLSIIEKALKFVTIFTKGDEQTIKYKNDVIARALLEILSSGKPSTQIRDQVLSILTRYNTNELNLETPVFQPGYTRPFRQCLLIDASGKIRDMELIISFIEGFLTEDYELTLPDGSFMYTLDDLKDALDFALISEGSLKSEKVYDDANLLRIRLHSLANGKEKVFFEYPEFVTKTQYIRNLLTSANGKKAQIINFSINYVDDRLAKNIVKIYSKLLFDYAKDVSKRNVLPFHILLEEAHRYIQEDFDKKILGYNIFERISKEGRKYGVLLGLISQRPSELSETVVSQCSNFIVFRMVHPRDINYIKDLIPNMSLEWMSKVKYLQPGTSVAFGTAFNIPVMIKFEMPYPAPESSSCDLSSIWFIDRVQNI